MQRMHGKSCKLAHSVSLQQVRIVHKLVGISMMAAKLVTSLLPCAFVLGFESGEHGASAAVHSVVP